MNSPLDQFQDIDIFKNEFEDENYKINFSNEFWIALKNNEHERDVKVITDVDQKFNRENFKEFNNCACNDILVTDIAVYKNKEKCINNCLKFVYLDSLNTHHQGTLIDNVFMQSSDLRTVYMFVTQLSFKDFIEKFKIRSFKQKKIFHSSFQNLVYNDQQKFQKIPFLCNRFFKIKNKDFQIQILKILSQVKYNTNRKFISFLKLSIKKLLHISYFIQVLKIIQEKKIFLKTKRKKPTKNDEVIKVEKQKLDFLLGKLNLKFSDLNLNNNKVKLRKSKKFYILSKSEICQNIFYTNRYNLKHNQYLINSFDSI